MPQMIRPALFASLGLLALGASPAWATEGYFVEGVSARDQSLAGAGSADSKEALTIANNPAGLVDVGRQFNGDVSIFAPNRQYDASGTVLVAPGTVESGRNVFVFPALAYAAPLSGDSAFGVGLYANGGMNTSYTTSAAGYACPRAASGVFCAGHTGVDLQQGFISVGYAQRFGSVSVGVAPVLAVQLFQAYGLGAFGSFGLSSNPGDLSDRGVDTSVGGGVRAGAQWRAADNFTLAVSGATPIWASSFSKYAGLFAGGGGFDVPGEIGAGVAYKATPVLTLLLDYKHIFYSGVKSVGNSSALTSPLGSADGPGFGWRDVDVIAFGLEWRALDQLTLRAGYAYNTNPITAADVTFNILAPGVVTNHITAGFGYAVDRNSSLDFAAVFSPRVKVSGAEVTPYGATPGSSIRIAMAQFEGTVGYSYHFDAPAPVVVAKY